MYSYIQHFLIFHIYKKKYPCSVRGGSLTPPPLCACNVQWHKWNEHKYFTAALTITSEFLWKKHE